MALSRADMLRDIPKGREARIEYAEKDGVKTATLISFKGIAKLPPEARAALDGSGIATFSDRARDAIRTCGQGAGIAD